MIFDLNVYYDLSSVQIHKALYKFLKSHWLYYNVDCVNKDSFDKLTERRQYDLYVTTVQCPPLNWISLGRIKSDNINRMIQLTDVTFLLKS